MENCCGKIERRIIFLVVSRSSQFAYFSTRQEPDQENLIKNLNEPQPTLYVNKQCRKSTPKYKKVDKKVNDTSAKAFDFR